MSSRRALAALLTLLATASLSAQDTTRRTMPMLPLQVPWRDLSPDSSTLHARNPNGASGGRVNGLAMSRDRAWSIAASEWGGLWASRDTGRTWSHVSAHVPAATWQVAIDPRAPEHWYATSFYDGRVHSLAGVNVTTDAGRSWTHPVVPLPTVADCADSLVVREPSGFGIALAPDAPSSVAVGTNCGLLLSDDDGVTWRRTLTVGTDAAAGNTIWSIVRQGGGLIDVCGDLGHRRSRDGGTTWSAAPTAPLPGGACALAAAPGDTAHLFAALDAALYETVDGGASWHPLPQQLQRPDGGNFGRIGWLGTNALGDGSYDLWYGYADLFRLRCRARSCPDTASGASANTGTSTSTGTAAPGWTYVLNGAHQDIGVVLFDPAATTDACPLLVSSDGGVFRNGVGLAPACQTPAFAQPERSPHALWIYSMQVTQLSSGGNTYHRIVLGAQDNGAFQTSRANADTVPWINTDPADAYDAAGDAVATVNSVCCYSDGTRLFMRRVGAGGLMTDTTSHRLVPPGGAQVVGARGSLAGVGDGIFALITTGGVYFVKVTSTDTLWASVGWPPFAFPTTRDNVSLVVARQPNQAIVYLRVARTPTSAEASVWQLQGLPFRTRGGFGLDAGPSRWVPVRTPDPEGSFGVFAVDESAPDRILASQMTPFRPPQMVLSLDAGASWRFLPTLDACLYGRGEFVPINQRGPTGVRAGNPGFTGYAQPSFAAFGTPMDSGRVLFAGGMDSGIFVSFDGGEQWHMLSSPTNPPGWGVPYIPRPLYAKVVDWQDGSFAYFGSQGRGVWRIFFPRRPRTTIAAPRC